MNKIERYGIREGDSPSLHPLIAVIGKREVERSIKNVIAPHKQPNPQLIYVDQGEMDWWVDGQFCHLSAGDLVLIKANETQTSLKGSIQSGCHYFMQISLDPIHAKDTLSTSEFATLNELIENFPLRTVSLERCVREYFESLLKVHREPNEFSSVYVKGLLFQILNQVDLAQRKHFSKVPKTDSTSSMLQEVDDYLEKNINRSILVKELSDLFELSEVHFRRKFSKVSGMSPLKYINQKKCNEARRMLFETDMSITEIALTLSYSSSQHFSSTFSALFSLSPREYRKEMKKAYEEIPLTSDAEVSNYITSKFI